MKNSRFYLLAVAALGAGILVNSIQHSVAAPEEAEKDAPVQGGAQVPPPNHEKPPEVGVIPKDDREKEYAKGNIDFDLLRTTKVNKKPPPVYTKTLESIDGQEISIKGFMAPYDDLDDMRNFMLFPFPVGCFFCAPPSIQEVLFVRQDTKKSAKFVDGAIEVKGTLKLWTAESEDEAHQQRFLYIIDKSKVEPFKVPEKKK